MKVVSFAEGPSGKIDGKGSSMVDDRMVILFHRPSTAD
jgi:hypothetical protein